MKPANNAPVYACIYAELAEIARVFGYALSVHGTLARDFDLVCIPWADDVAPPQSVVNLIKDKFAIRQIGEPVEKNHSRLVYTICFAFGEVSLDLSFMPASRYS